MMDNLTSNPYRLGSRTIHNIALAYFQSSKNLYDAARDLCSAGFHGEEINISASVRQEATPKNMTESQPVQGGIGAHSLRWQINRIRAHDRQRRGADQISGLNRMPGEVASPTCATLDLSAALRALAVSSDVISLLKLDVKDGGMFLLVDAVGRVAEASAILSENAGYLRTQYLVS